MARVTRVVIQPLSGYINRIQAMASAYLLAQDLGSELAVSWVPEQVSPAMPHELFTKDFLHDLSFGAEFFKLSPYLNFDPKKRIISLAGLDRGEQFFMGELHSLVESIPGDVELRVSAGGKFSFNNETFVQRRRYFYRNVMRFVEEVEETAVAESAAHKNYLGLHLRYSDRSHQAPLSRTVSRALGDLATATGLDSIFVASDMAAQKIAWMEKIAHKGLVPWSAASDHTSRLESRGAVAAMIDWRILSNSHGVVYFSESSFGEEAAIAVQSGGNSVALQGSQVRRLGLKARELAMAFFTYPRRHWGN